MPRSVCTCTDEGLVEVVRRGGEEEEVRQTKQKAGQSSEEGGDSHGTGHMQPGSQVAAGQHKAQVADLVGR